MFADGDYVITHSLYVYAPGTPGTAVVDIFRFEGDKIEGSFSSGERFTTYSPETIELNGSPLTDAVDGDAGELDTSGAPTVIVRLGDLEQADGAQVVTFSVTID